MNKDDLIFIILPFFISAVIIFGHYQFLQSQNPQAHSSPTISKTYVQSISAEDLSPISPLTPLPKKIIGIASEIPTNSTQLSNLLNSLKSNQANTLILILGITIDSDGDLIFPKALESSEEMLIRWTKKTASEAHKQDFHTYISLTIIGEPEIKDFNKYSLQLGNFIQRWSTIAQEYFVSFFDPGLIVGHPTYNSIDQEQFKELLVMIERQTRRSFTRSIGINLCCDEENVNPTGYNHILILSRGEGLSAETKTKIIQTANSYNLEHVFLLNVDASQLSTIF